MSCIPGPGAPDSAPTRNLTAWTDDQLVASIRAGAVMPLEEVHRRYRRLMLAAARPLVAGTAFDAEDVVQDALVRVMEALPRDQRRIALRPWLLAVVRNRAIDLRRRSDSVTQTLPADMPFTWNGTDEEVILRESFGRTVKALATLPPRQRAALTARCLDGASHEELAGRLGCSVGAARALTMRARRSMAAAA